MIADQSLYLALLLRGERTACALGAMPMADRHRCSTAALIRLGGRPHRALTNLAKPGCLGNRRAGKTHLYCPSPMLVQYRFR